ncbi:MAG: amidohydrolase [Gammaproteobacteria bacterium]|nr:MAG: amidohydrolase [Gammaproteobacteria bacterium]
MASNPPDNQQAQWLAQVQEDIIEPDLPICDAHHHLWLNTGHTGWPYTLKDLHADTATGHNIVRTVFIECHAQYRKDGPEHLRPVGETEFVVELAERSTVSGQAEIAAIMGHADLSMGDAVEDVLAAHEDAGRGIFRGIRYITAQDTYPPLSMGECVQMDHANFLAGVRKLGALSYTFDAFVYHPQLLKLAAVAKACPETPIVIDHLGGFLGVGPYKGKREEIYRYWKGAIKELARAPNTYLKLGGIGMPMFGFRWDKQERPPTSKELAAPWIEPIQYAIEQFGPARCMFESNFPVDKRGTGYVVLWNAFKRIASEYTADEKRDLFHNTAARAYRIESIE